MPDGGDGVDVVQEFQPHPPPSLPLEGGGIKKNLKEKGSEVSAYALQGRGIISESRSHNGRRDNEKKASPSAKKEET